MIYMDDIAVHLHRRAVEAMGKAYAPYSNFPVGAAILSFEGDTWVGCNVENASYPEGWCAETSAIANMVIGGDRRISRIAVAVERGKISSPCGGCRQRIAEFSDKDTIIYLCNKEEILESMLFFDLLPKAFALKDEE